MNKNILLICWDFPPNKGIGGRRWGKFAKSLAKKGYHIHVIKSTPLKSNTISPWAKDTKSENIHVHEIKTSLLVKWLHEYLSPISFLKIRLAQLGLKLFSKGTIYDKALGVEKQFHSLATALIQQYNIQNIIVTGAPFNLLYYTVKLKSAFKNIHIIADYRDPWINSVNYGMNFLDTKRKREEEAKQNMVFEKTDLITAPNEFLIEQIKETYKGDKTSLPEFKVLSHIYDPDDMAVQTGSSPASDKLRLVYAGALYTDSEKYLALLFSAILIFQDKFPSIAVELDIYTDHSVKTDIPSQIKAAIKIKPQIGDKIFSIMSTYDMMIILLTHHNKDFKTTKFFEFLPYKVPYLYIGPEGYVSESIVNDKLGFVITGEEDLVKIHQELNEQKSSDKKHTDISCFSLDAVTETLTNEFK